MNTTIDYYNQNAVAYVKSTVNVEFSATQERFLSYLKLGTKILDVGCGSGRDAKFFLSKGFSVVATDGSEEFCKMASEYTGIPVQKMLFSELNSTEEYDGIWACSSILHLPKSELSDVFGKILMALKRGGVLYTSFKYGEFEGERRGRFFTDFTSESFRTFIGEFPKLVIIEEWISLDVRPGRGDEKWLNLIIQKKD